MGGEEAGFGKEEVVGRLAELDERMAAVMRPGRRLPVVVVGGSALVLSGLGDPSRVTRGIDMVDVPIEAALNMGGLDMNNAADTFVYQMPSGWRDRLVDLGLPLVALDVLTPSAADLAAMKLCSGRPQDLEDVASMLARGPGLDRELRSLLADPLEVAVNLSGEEWRGVQERLGECERRAGVGGGRGGAARISWEARDAPRGESGPRRGRGPS